MFLTKAYGKGWIHFKTYGNTTEVTAQWLGADGRYVIRPAASARGAKSLITRNTHGA